jgi:hypothetical protein
MKTLAQFDAAQAAARLLFLQTCAFADVLPTAGVSIAWIGENGYEADGNTPKPPIEKTMAIEPSSIYDRVLDGCRHISYAIPNSFGQGKDEPTHDRVYRRDFARKYLLAILNAYEPFMVDTVAIRGQYHSLVSELFDFDSDKDHKGSKVVSRGRYAFNATTGSGFSSLELEFHAKIADGTLVEVTIKLEPDFSAWRLMPHGRGTEHGIKTWEPVNYMHVGAVHNINRPGAGKNGYGIPDSYRQEWLFADRAKVEEMIGLNKG